MVLAKALQTAGETFVTDAKGRSHNWRDELGRKLISLQHPEGYGSIPFRMKCRTTRFW